MGESQVLCKCILYKGSYDKIHKTSSIPNRGISNSTQNSKTNPFLVCKFICNNSREGGPSIADILHINIYTQHSDT